MYFVIRMANCWRCNCQTNIDLFSLSIQHQSQQFIYFSLVKFIANSIAILWIRFYQYIINIYLFKIKNIFTIIYNNWQNNGVFFTTILMAKYLFYKIRDWNGIDWKFSRWSCWIFPRISLSSVLFIIWTLLQIFKIVQIVAERAANTCTYI